jgi:hypothetical protein
MWKEGSTKVLTFLGEGKRNTSYNTGQVVEEDQKLCQERDKLNGETILRIVRLTGKDEMEEVVDEEENVDDVEEGEGEGGRR